ncbi:hypothetical protein MPH_01482 [Macrophomina phaseolina MS6]|uniref:Uncharacterized protein n=1 Tax=Macrophomina phaseolina (strain MS6) TaxID=1126212 RepID=K2SFH6_MACPH|nr:hypothetical protein MPH_01482 [Macrophomina phaseolina MS6]
MPVLLQFSDRLIQDIRNGTVPPHSAASLHLISFLKEAKEFGSGAEFWSWLRRKDNDYVDAAVYGAAIEMLASQRKVELPELETLYTEALRRFPGNFAEYHLSPEAIVLDRGQPVMIKGLPMSLLQGIVTARLAYGDWRNAYLAFDTALRLYPTQVPERFFELFIHGRPLAESYTVFMMACRSGVILRPEQLTVVLRNLADSQFRAPVQERLLAVQGMLNAVHAYAGVGGSVGGHHLSTLVKGFEGLLPGFSSQENLASDAINQLIGDTARETMLNMSRAGVPLTLSTIASLVGLAGKARLPELLGRAIQDILNAGLEPNEVVHRSMVLAAGQIKHIELLEWSWRSLVESSEASGTQLDVRDWQALARASINADHISFVRQQTSALSHAVTDEITKIIEHELAKGQPTAGRGMVFTNADNECVNKGMPELKSQVEAICALIASGKLRNFFEHPLPTSLVPRPSLGSEPALRAVYDELTTDPRLATTNQPLQSAMKSASGYPLDALRYANWTSVNELLNDADAHEAGRQRVIEKAQREGGGRMKLEAAVRSFSRPTLAPRRSLGDQEADGGSGAARGNPVADDDASGESIDAARQEVRRLRALQDQPRFALNP